MKGTLKVSQLGWGFWNHLKYILYCIYHISIGCAQICHFHFTAITLPNLKECSCSSVIEWQGIAIDLRWMCPLDCAKMTDYLMVFYILLIKLFTLVKQKYPMTHDFVYCLYTWQSLGFKLKQNRDWSKNLRLKS